MLSMDERVRVTKIKLFLIAAIVVVVLLWNHSQTGRWVLLR